MVHLNYKRFAQMRSCRLADVKTIPPSKNRFVSKIIIHQYTMCEMINLDNKRSAALLGSGIESGFWSRVEGRGSRVQSRGSRVTCRGSRVQRRGFLKNKKVNFRNSVPGRKLLLYPHESVDVPLFPVHCTRTSTCTPDA